MSRQLIPIFPLSLVLLPGMPVPLRIFEERYKQMMNDIIPIHAEFGIVLAKEEGIVNIGCTATVVDVLRKYPDGRLDLVAAGQRRFRIESLDEDKPYLRAEVEYFDDEDVNEAPLSLRLKAGKVYRQLFQVERPDEQPESAEEVIRLSFRMGQLISDLNKRQTILSIRSETERLEYLLKIIPEYIVQKEQTALAKRVGPQNGHAKHLKH